MQEFYKILGITEDATDGQVLDAYNELKAKYKKERFLEGEAGNEAARNLTKIETAFNEIMEARKNVADKESGKTENLSKIEECIKNGDFSKAQILLDNVNERTAEWHYLQSVLFYKKNWLNDSKKQLEIAMNMDPRNEKYSEAYTKLKQKMEFNQRQFQQERMNQQNQYAQNNAQMGESGIDECFRFCGQMVCLNCLCNSFCR